MTAVSRDGLGAACVPGRSPGPPAAVEAPRASAAASPDGIPTARMDTTTAAATTDTMDRLLRGARVGRRGTVRWRGVQIGNGALAPGHVGEGIPNRRQAEHPLLLPGANELHDGAVLAALVTHEADDERRVAAV